MFLKDYQMKYFLIIIICCFQIPAVFAESNSNEGLVQEAFALGLDSHPTWLKLLYYDSLKLKSEVLSDTFFLSDSGRNNPTSELKAVLGAYESKASDNNSPLCRFPARYLWLSQQIELPGYNFRQDACSYLEQWAKFDEVTSISAIMVSGYFGNPASTFGHSLLKFNGPAESRYLDLTFNYGAVVPENENMVRYIFKGVFGGYESGFSDGYFFSQDMVYSRTEFRDMWDYELYLSDFERELLISHLWEVSGERFDYLFLTKNCAFRLAQVLELVEDSNSLTKRSALWYAPVELFNRIDDLDRLKDGRYIKNITFVPSYQNQLHAKLKNLSADEMNAFNDFIRNEKLDYSGLTETQKYNVLDTLITYAEFKDVELMDASNLKYKNLKRKVMLERLQLAPRAATALVFDELPSPSQTSPPIRIAIGVNRFTNTGDNKLDVAFSPFHYDSIGLNSLNGGRLVVMNANIQVDDNSARLNSLDIIDVRKMPAPKINIKDIYELAWELNLGLKRNNEEDLRPAIEIGLFDGISLTGLDYFFGLNVVAWNHNDSFLHLRPYFEVSHRKDKLFGELRASKLFSQFGEDQGVDYNLRVNYFMKTRSALGLNIKHSKDTTFGLNYQHYF